MTAPPYHVTVLFTSPLKHRGIKNSTCCRRIQLEGLRPVLRADTLDRERSLKEGLQVRLGVWNVKQLKLLETAPGGQFDFLSFYGCF